MSLLDDLKDVTKLRNKTVRCSLCITFLSLPEEEKKALHKSVMNSSVPAIYIVRILKLHGHHATDQAIWKHRREECASASF